LRVEWIVTIVLGGVVGWLASVLMKVEARMGVVAGVVVGVIGSALGFWGASMVGISAGAPLVGWVVAVAGAVLLILLLQAFDVFQ
jgi:uncharacterized membrane protein YeaQ/YmgE (transglycosylase-associated protein family)